MNLKSFISCGSSTEKKPEVITDAPSSGRFKVTYNIVRTTG